MASKSAKVRALQALCLLTLTGCNLLPPELEKYWVQFKREWNAVETVAGGGRSPLVQPSGGGAGSDDQLISQHAKNAKANAELLQEVYRVVFQRDPLDRSEFGSLVDSLNQGASFEGVYNGFIHSTEYRKLEISNSGASPEALKAFGQELAFLELELPTPTEFGSSPARQQAGGLSAGVSEVEYGKVAASPSPVKLDAGGLAESYARYFLGSSVFVLKRVIGDEALKVMTVKKEYPEKMALWYSRWVVRLAARNVDFGIALRNIADETFHYKWALTASEDRIKWEVLNRLHRVLNEANRLKQ